MACALVATLPSVPIGAATGTSPVLQASVTADAGIMPAGSPVTVHVTLRNPTAHAVAIAAWDTPARGVRAPVFRVALDGLPVPYTGMLAKRVDDPASADLVTLAAGSSRSWTVDLASAWAFTRTGTYTVQFDSPAVVVPSKPLRLAVAARTVTPPPRTRTARDLLAPRSVAYTNCTSGQETQAAAAVPAADAYAAEIEAYLTANRAGSRYTTWFGAFDRTRWNTVRANVGRIRAVTAGGSLELICATIAECGGAGVFAFVYRNQPYRVYLCGEFWNTSTTGTDSRAGTLIHEIAHFTVVADTYDHAYGQVAAANLATTNPQFAVANSDNYEYFAENTPAIADAGAAFTTDAAALDFGAVGVGGAASRTLTLTSTGGGPALISTVSSGDPSFEVTGSTCSSGAIPIAATCTITVRFTPAGIGARATSLAIASDAPAAPDAIPLSGNGLGAAEPPQPAAQVATPAPAIAPAARATSRPQRLASRLRALVTPARLVAAAGIRVPAGARVRIGRLPRGVTRGPNGVRATRKGTFRIPVTVVAPGARPASGTATLVVR